MISPGEFEISYKKKEKALYGFLAANPTVLIFLGALILECVLWMMYQASFGTYRTAGSFLILQYIRSSLLCVVPFSILCFYAPSRFKTALQFICFLAMWFITSHEAFDRIDSIVLRCFCYLSVPLICCGGCCLMVWRYRNPDKSWWPGALLFSLFFLLISISISVCLNNGWHQALMVFWSSKMQFYWITLLIWSYQKSLKRDDIKIAIHPINSLRGVFWPQDFSWQGENAAQKKELWWWGFGSILLGTLILLLKMFLDRGSHFLGHSLLSRGTAQYFLDRLSDVGIFNVIIGSVRLFGYRVQDATNFVFLSRTPADSWRRVSVYNYLFVLRYVYMPLLRFTRNTFVVTFVAFLVYFLNHQTSLHIRNLAALMGFGAIAPGQRIVFFGTLFGFLSSFLLIYFSRKNWLISWKKMENPFFAWISIASTHLVFIIARILTLLVLRGF
jgi:hypothetical protein